MQAHVRLPVERPHHERAPRHLRLVGVHARREQAAGHDVHRAAADAQLLGRDSCGVARPGHTHLRVAREAHRLRRDAVSLEAARGRDLASRHLDGTPLPETAVVVSPDPAGTPVAARLHLPAAYGYGRRALAPPGRAAPYRRGDGDALLDRGLDGAAVDDDGTIGLVAAAPYGCGHVQAPTPGDGLHGAAHEGDRTRGLLRRPAHDSAPAR